jgi:hypothetical protein
LQKLIRNYQESQHKLESELDEIERKGREERDKILNK